MPVGHEIIAALVGRVPRLHKTPMIEFMLLEVSADVRTRCLLGEAVH